MQFIERLLRVCWKVNQSYVSLVPVSPSPDDKLLLDVFIDDEVQVSLSVASLLVLETKVQVRQHV